MLGDTMTSLALLACSYMYQHAVSAWARASDCAERAGSGHKYVNVGAEGRHSHADEVLSDNEAMDVFRVRTQLPSAGSSWAALDRACVVSFPIPVTRTNAAEALHSCGPHGSSRFLDLVGGPPWVRVLNKQTKCTWLIRLSIVDESTASRTSSNVTPPILGGNEAWIDGPGRGS